MVLLSEVLVLEEVEGFVVLVLVVVFDVEVDGLVVEGLVLFALEDEGV